MNLKTGKSLLEGGCEINLYLFLTDDYISYGLSCIKQNMLLNAHYSHKKAPFKPQDKYCCVVVGGGYGGVHYSTMASNG